jgi:subtilase family serine protease
MKKFLPIIFSVALSTVVHAQPTSITKAKNAHRSIQKAAVVSPTQSTTITKNTPGFIKKASDLGAVDPNTVITVTTWLNLHNQTQLDALVQGQYKKGSSTYHKWITQSQFNSSYGATSQEVDTVKNFLSSNGLTVIDVAEDNAYVKVQGTVGTIQKTFHVQIDNYKLNGNNYRSNKSDPTVNGQAGKYIAAITGMDDLGFQPKWLQASTPDGKPFPARPLSKNSPRGMFFEGQAFRSPQTVMFSNATNTATYTGNRYGADITNTTQGHLPPQGYSPSEVRTAYGLNALYQQSPALDGTGETIVITDAYGSSTLAGDVATFCSGNFYNLPPVDLTIVKAQGLPSNPHGPARTWDVETTLDVEWAHAIAPGAKIVLVLATDHGSLDEAINYAVIHRLGNTISNSWSTVEGLGNPAQFNRTNRILQMAAAQGIDVNFASGDFGDESFPPDLPLGVGFVSVDFPASSPFATGVGGTSLALNSDNSIMWQTGWGNNLNRIADTVALGSPPVVPPLNDPAQGGGFAGGAGGGESLTFARPAFQAGVGVPPNGNRMVPDIGWLADPFTGVEFVFTDPFVGPDPVVEVIGGTSLSCPMFSALMAIAAQKNNHVGLGQAAALVYNLPANAVLDITPVGSANNVTGNITGPGGGPQTADDLAKTAVFDGSLYTPPVTSPTLFNTTTYYSALYNSPFSTRWFVITFGTDTSLTTGPGWDNVTGVGTPNGLNFVNAITPP